VSRNNSIYRANIMSRLPCAMVQNGGIVVQRNVVIVNLIAPASAAEAI
jgi:hypothetical protein